MPAHILRGPILNPRPDGSIRFLRDGAIKTDDAGRIDFVGPWLALQSQLGSRQLPTRRSDGLVSPPFIDNHTHISQFPIRGRFTEGVADDAPQGKLIAGLNRNVFPAEIRCAERTIAAQVTKQFYDDCLSHGVVGGFGWMTVHADAVRIALEMLPPTWNVGLVLMNMNGPPDLRTNEATLDEDIESLVRDFGTRLTLNDRFAVTVDSPLRRRVVALSKKFGLRMTTHLNEQRSEKEFVEKKLYPDASSYTDVYLRDGLLDRDAIVAHCIWNRAEEFDILARTGTAIAHCPVSNTSLDSGVMPLDAVLDRGIAYSICTDVGASPTTSLLNEMSHFLEVHAGRSTRATPQEALYRTTLAATKIAHLDDQLGSFDVGKPLSFVEIASNTSPRENDSANDVIKNHLLPGRVIRVTLADTIAWERR